MCGIVGYWGPKDPKQVIYDGLKRLEYRGYDSAGIAVLNGASFKCIRAEGKLQNLEPRLKELNFVGHLGIGHTRWATHGIPSERNAHPHTVDGVSLVHNGIIENYLEIRDELIKSGADVKSDTDSELVAHLVAREVKTAGSLEKAVLNVMPRLHGAYSIVVVWEHEPETMVAFKNGPPLILGIGEKESIIASDVQALIEHTRRVVYLEDNEVVVTKGASYKVLTPQGKPVHKEVVEVDWTSDKAEKKGFEHYMLKEIFEQPRAIAAALEPHLNLGTKQVQLKDLKFAKGESWLSKAGGDEGNQTVPFKDVVQSIDRVFILGCGTSYYAALVGEYLIEKMAHLPVEVEFASEFRYRDPVLTPHSLVITISQSGETADTLAALRLAKSLGALTLSICNVKNSSIDREAHGHLYMKSDVEICVASTKVFTCTLAILNAIAIAFGVERGHINRDQESKMVEDLLALPSLVESVLVHDKFFREAAQTLSKFKGFLYIGRGVNYPIALEGALKLKELAYMHAEGYAAGEMKHGPIALIDKDMAIVVVCPQDDVFEKTLSNLEEVRARGGQIISLGTGENDKLRRLSLHYLALPDASWNLNPILAAIPVQLLGYHVANARGHDIDQPRNLAKSVTVE